MKTRPQMSTERARVLDSVQKALAGALNCLKDREQALAALAQPAFPKALNFVRLEESLAALDGKPGRSARQLLEIDAALTHGEDEIRRWLARAGGLRRQLDSWEARAVG